MAEWRQKASELATIYEERAAREKSAGRASHIRELRRRLKRAQEEQDEAATARWQRLLDQAESNDG